MSKYTKHTHDQLKQLVLEAQMMRYTIEETMAYVQKYSPGNIELKYKTIATMRMNLKKAAIAEFTSLLSTRYEYQLQFLERVHALKNLIRKQWALHDKAQTEFIELNTMKEIHQLENSLHNLYMCAPSISGVKQSMVITDEMEQTDGIVEADITRRDNNSISDISK